MAGIRHFLLIAFLITIGGLTFQCAKKSPKEPSLADSFETPDWFLNGKPAPLSASLTAITDSIIPSLDILISAYYDCLPQRYWQIDTVGKWFGRTVVDLFYITQLFKSPDTAKVDTFKAVKAIAVETSPGKYRLCDVYWSDRGALGFQPSTIELFQGKPAIFNSILRSPNPLSFPTWQYYIIWNDSGSFPQKILWHLQEEKPRFESLMWLCFNTRWLEYLPVTGNLTLDTLNGNNIESLFRSSRIVESAFWSLHHLRWKEDTLGIINKQVFEKISFVVALCRRCDSIGKVFAVEQKNHTFRPLYAEYTLKSDTCTERDTIITLDGVQVIAIKGRSGNFGAYTDNYWIWNNARDIPVSLYQEWVLTETLKRVIGSKLPPGLSARLRLGKWDFYKLSYETYTWAATDPDGKPSGGKLKIQFGIRNDRLVPVDYSYDPNDVKK